jgi:predicted DNA-binding protein (MmcQ/YjbR family)
MSSHPKASIDDSIMERMRAICLPLPEAEESEAFDAPTFKIRNKNFAMLHQPDGRTSVWCKATMEAQQALIHSEPKRYYSPPYVGHKGWVAAWLDADVDPDWEEIDEIITESYRLIAPKRLVKAMDEARSNAT